MIELKKTQNGIEMAAREIPIAGQWDVVVVGGGMGGVGAAMAAGKRGWKTLLIESMGALGGLATMGLVNIPLDFVSGLGVEMIDELEKIDGHRHRHGHITGREHPPARRGRKGVTGRADRLGLQHRPEYARDSRCRSQRVVRGPLCQPRAGRLQPPARRLRALA